MMEKCERYEQEPCCMLCLWVIFRVTRHEYVTFRAKMINSWVFHKLPITAYNGEAFLPRHPSQYSTVDNSLRFHRSKAHSADKFFLQHILCVLSTVRNRFERFTLQRCHAIRMHRDIFEQHSSSNRILKVSIEYRLTVLHFRSII